MPEQAPVSGETVARTALSPGTGSARLARTWAREVLTAAGVDDGLLESAVLVASELVTNAVRHGRGDVVLSLLTAPAAVSVGVHDDSPGRPSVIDPYEGGGRGMLVIESISSRLEVVPDDRGKTVWAHFSPPAA